MSEGEIITRRRKWSPAQKSALLDEVEAENGKVAVVARRHGISESLLYNWRSAWKAAACVVSAPETGGLRSARYIGRSKRGETAIVGAAETGATATPQASEGGAGTIEIALPNGVRICVGGLVNEKALSRVLRAMRSAL